MIIPHASLARALVAAITAITVPDRSVYALERDRQAGVELACGLAHAVADSRAFDGVHLIPGIRYRETAVRLEELTRGR